jgi:hypothetical protein
MVPVPGVKDILSVSWKIKEVVDTVHENNMELEKLHGTIVETINTILRENTERLNDPAMHVTLKKIKDTLDDALKVIDEDRKRNIAERLYTAKKTAKLLRRVREEISLHIQLDDYAMTNRNYKMTAYMFGMLKLTKTTIRPYDGPLPPFPLPQVRIHHTVFVLITWSIYTCMEGTSRLCDDGSSSDTDSPSIACN